MKKTVQALSIIFEDKDILVLDKPSGVVVDRNRESGQIETLQDWLEQYLKLSPSVGAFRQRTGIVHRLDKETSGLLVVAKTPTSFENLQQQFKQRLVEKKYLALVHGMVKPSSGEISSPISRNPYNRRKFGIYPGGRFSQTRYEVVKYCTRGDKSFTYLKLFPKTGRTHQLRVHLKYLGYPIVGDEKYAGRKTSRSDRKWCPRQFLHAFFLSFSHPASGKRVEFTSSLPEELKKALTTCFTNEKN